MKFLILFLFGISSTGCVSLHKSLSEFHKKEYEKLNKGQKETKSILKKLDAKHPEKILETPIPEPPKEYIEESFREEAFLDRPINIEVQHTKCHKMPDFRWCKQYKDTSIKQQRYRKIKRNPDGTISVFEETITPSKLEVQYKKYRENQITLEEKPWNEN